MSNYDFEEENEMQYEDELDRMRLQRKKRYSDSRSDSEESSEDTDFDYVDLEDASEDAGSEEDTAENGCQDITESQRRHRSPLEWAADRYMGEEEESSDMGQKKRISDARRDSVRMQQISQKAYRKKRKRRKRGRILKLLLLLLFLTTGILYAQRWTKDRDGYWNIAVFGVDSRDNNLGKGALADVQMLASINKKSGEIRLVSIYRDTYVQINNDGDFHKINEAYFKGGPQQALDTLKRNLDITVDDYAAFNWKAVADAINILGGIDLEITDKEFAYINSFITETVESTGVYSTHLEHAGMNHLDGVQAVAYSRLRLMDTDFNRTERQRKVVYLALEKAKQADFKTLKTVAGTVIPEISTSIGAEDVISLAKDARHYYLGQTGGFPFAKTTARVKKMDCVIPMTLESNVTLLHQFLFDKEGYQPSQSVKAISAKISEKTGIYEEGKAAGADKNLPGGAGGGNTGSNGNGSADLQPEAAPQESAVPEIPDESSSLDAASDADLDGSPEDETNSDDSEHSGGSSDDESDHSQNEKDNSDITVIEPLKPDETTLSEEQIYEGPGAVTSSKAPSENGNSVSHSKPIETASEEFGPGFE
ncbi:MAG: LCP family protein [Lachnospiraceae bacterium]|nr:LCP family protein [Lachnospiraceae bacterium]